ncbi:hypothetical protein FIT78_00070 [Candidatus Methylopumilus universalis]|uniref:hypothetical protein n=1 Tax=Candidatus Methylopumilus universalis TaxID=2588536 RepID=UPI00111D03B4|nr:hypothetical protein [Candidatus Methylopumilus universalis]QDC97048.1 hypothetical protein FIT78_00070 [Candidatus Methylopumilus universalis]
MSKLFASLVAGLFALSLNAFANDAAKAAPAAKPAADAKAAPAAKPAADAKAAPAAKPAADAKAAK